jgi:hypothetical protein
MHACMHLRQFFLTIGKIVDPLFIDQVKFSWAIKVYAILKGQYSGQRVHTLCQKCWPPQLFNALLGLPRL